MARPSLVPAEQVGPHFVGATPPDMAAQEGAVRQHLSVVDMQFAIDGEAYSLERIKLLTPAAIDMTRMGILWLGRALVLVAEHETKAEYDAYLDEFGISEATARQYRRAALVTRERPRLADLGASKVLALASESDEDLDALIAGGTIAGAAIDDIAAMTTREVKAALRAERKARNDEKAADEEIIRGKDERINKMLRDRRKVESGGPRIKAAELLADMDQQALELARLATEITEGIHAVRRIYGDEGAPLDPEVATRMRQNIDLAAEWLRALSLLVDGE